MPPGVLKLFFDGGCRPNPGRMETAVVARGVTYHQSELGVGTNDDAEWLAAIHALCIAEMLGERDIVLIGDSATVVRQATGKAAPRGDRLIAHLAAFTTLVKGFDRVRIRHTRRSQNLAGTALERLHGRR